MTATPSLQTLDEDLKALRKAANPGRAFGNISEYDAAEASLRALFSGLHRENAELREDKARLDWLETQSLKRNMSIGFLDEGHEEFALYEPAEYLSGDAEDAGHWRIVQPGESLSLREVIDAARAPSQESTP